MCDERLTWLPRAAEHELVAMHIPRLVLRRYVLSTDARLLRLKPYAQSPVTWFRNPYAYLVLVSSLA